VMEGDSEAEVIEGAVDDGLETPHAELDGDVEMPVADDDAEVFESDDTEDSE